MEFGDLIKQFLAANPAQKESPIEYRELPTCYRGLMRYLQPALEQFDMTAYTHSNVGDTWELAVVQVGENGKVMCHIDLSLSTFAATLFHPIFDVEDLLAGDPLTILSDLLKRSTIVGPVG